MSVVADEQATLDADAEASELFDLRHQRDGIEHNTVPDDARNVSMENAGRDKMKDILFRSDAVRSFCWDNDRVPCVCPTLIARNDIDIFA